MSAERNGEEDGWVEEKFPGGSIFIRSVSSEIQKQMPSGSETFVQKGAFKILAEEIKKLLRGEPNTIA